MLETHLARKTIKKKQTHKPPNPQATQSFSMPHYMEKKGGLLCHKTSAPNLLGRRRPTGEQISGMCYTHSHPWDKPA
jgi:hypothetical protein